MNAVTRSSIEASVLTTLITQPIWVIKTRMLLNMNQKISEYENFKKQVKEIRSQYGAKGFLRARLGREIELKFTPELHFIADASYDEATAIDRLLNDPRVRRDVESEG